jgi:hypothetical protein
VKIRWSVTASTKATRVKLSYVFRIAVPSMVVAPMAVSYAGWLDAVVPASISS